MYKFLYLFIFAVFISCSGDEDQPAPQQLNGDWYLTSVACYCGFEEDMDFTDHKLRFEAEDNVLHLFHPPGSPSYIGDSGTYTYELEGDLILIEDAPPFKYELQGAELILTLVDNPSMADDELVLVFQRE